MQHASLFCNPLTGRKCAALAGDVVLNIVAIPSCRDISIHCNIMGLFRSSSEVDIEMYLPIQT